MSEHERRLRDLLDKMRERYPQEGHDAVLALDALVKHQKTVGLEDAMSVFSARQAKMQAERLKKGALPEKVRDCADDAKRCSWVIHVLRAEDGRRKKGKAK
jgi:hypothetical protein